MQLYIGENIKRLRKQKGITQETLAEHMHVSIAAVSKWERNETLPDISMVIPLASYFGVSTDEILGLDEAKNEEKIKLYLEETNRLAALGKANEHFDLITKAYHEFPNDWRIMERYMWQLNYDPHCTDPYGNEVHKEELYRLCERVLDECNIDKIRYSALQAKDIDSHEKINQLQKAISLIKMIFDDGDYGFYHYDLSDLYIWIANRYVMLNDPDNAFKNYELGFKHAKAYDDLPKITTHTSFLVKGKIFDRTKTNSSTEANMVSRQITCLRSWGIYEKVKDTPQMQALFAKYEPFAGNKKDYT